MRELTILLTHLIVTLAKCLRPSGVRAVVAESLLLKQQLIVLNRSRERAPNLRPMDRVIAAGCAFFMSRARLLKSAVAIRPSTILGFHRALVARKYRLLFTPKRGGPPVPRQRAGVSLNVGGVVAVMFPTAAGYWAKYASRAARISYVLWPGFSPAGNA
jgi:hypothetical protein